MVHLQQELRSKKKFAKFVSLITHPPIISVPTFIIIILAFMSFTNSVGIIITCMIFGAVIPVFTSLVLIKKMGIDLDITDRTKRTLPLILAIISYIIGFLILYFIKAPPVVTVLMLCYFTNTLIILFINFKWKISIHAMGIAGPTVALTYVFGFYGVFFGFLILLVMWSRVTLQKHTISQVLAGAFLGILLTAAQLNYIVPLIS